MKTPKSENQHPEEIRSLKIQMTIFGCSFGFRVSGLFRISGSSDFGFIRRALVALIATGAFIASAGEPVSIRLPAPQMQGGRPLMEVLRDRKTTRDFSAKPLTSQTLANLLWAGFGINRPDIAHRTAPSAMNSQEMDIYVATSEGVYVYDATSNQLQPVARGDIRAQTGGQDFVKQAPVALLFVADLARLEKAKPADKERYAGIDTGSICQNIYLFCASEGLATVVHELDRTKLEGVLKLRPDQKVILAQSVGYPKDTPKAAAR